MGKAKKPKKKKQNLIGASNHTKETREENDFYATATKDCARAFEIFLRDGITIAPRVWESACGEGHMAKALADLKKDKEPMIDLILCTDIIKRRMDFDLDQAKRIEFRKFDFLGAGLFDVPILEFLTKEGLFEGDVITNPPFKIFTEFFLSAMQRLKKGSKLFILLPSRYAEGQDRYEIIFKHFNPCFEYQYSYRIDIGKEGDFSGGNFVAYSWFIWEKGWTGETIKRWIPK